MNLARSVAHARSKRHVRARLRGKTRKSSLRERPIAILPGQYFDAETGLHQNWHRDYDPSIGRYLQSDPIGLQGGINTYTYALDNPILNSDVTGLDSTSIACAFGDSAACNQWVVPPMPICKNKEECRASCRRQFEREVAEAGEAAKQKYKDCGSPSSLLDAAAKGKDVAGRVGDCHTNAAIAQLAVNMLVVGRFNKCLDECEED
jgi:RHS repeat-associated protein